MRLRTMIAALIASSAATAVIAQSDPIEARKALMKAQNDQARVAVRMMRGDTPFETAQADAVFKAFADTTEKLGALFPDNSKTGDTKAAPAIWTDRAGFDAALAKFAKDVNDNRAKTGTLDDFKVAIRAVGSNCDSCHNKYRMK
jgi:cytochrome c556